MNINPVTKPNTGAKSNLPCVGAGEILDGPTKDTEKPVPLRALLTRPVVVSVANFCMIALFDIITEALIPLAWSTSVEFGGLGMSPASVGLCMAGFGLLNGIFQFYAFPYFVARFGPRRVFIASTLCYLPIYLLFPFENLAMRHSGRGGRIVAGLLIILQLVAMTFSDMGFSESPGTPYSVLRTVTKVVRIPPRHDIHVLVLCRAQQAVSRRDEWSCADDGLDPARGRTSSRLVAVCIFAAQQYIGGELCVCRAARACVGRAGRRFEASEEHVEA